MNRRDFFERVKMSVVRWCPWLGLMGFRLKESIYQSSTGPFKVKWVEWCGKAVGWLGESGKIVWLNMR